MFDKIIDSVIGTAHTRLKDPAIGAFVFSWLLINWKIPLLVFSNTYTTEAKIIKISEIDLFSLHSLGIPVFAAVSLPLLIPYFSSLMESNVTNKIETNRLKARHELTKTKMGVEKMEGVFQEHEELKRSHDKISQDYDRLFTEKNELDNNIVNIKAEGQKNLDIANGKIDEVSAVNKKND